MKKIYTLGLGILLSGSILAQNELSISPSKDVNTINSSAVTPGINVLNNTQSIQLYSYDNEVYVNLEGFGNIDGEIQIFDMLGKQVLLRSFNTSNLVLPVNVVTSSLYIVNVTVNGNSVSDRLYIK